MSLNFTRIGMVAARDYKAVITSKGFLIGILIMPVMLLILTVLVPRILNSNSPQVTGEVAIIDPTGKVAEELKHALVPADIERRKAAEADQKDAPPASGPRSNAVGPPIVALTLTTLPPDTNVETRKSWLIQDVHAVPQHVAIVVVKPDAVAMRSGATAFGTYELYTNSHIEDDTEDTLRGSLRAALVAARLRTAGLDPVSVAIAQTVSQPDSVVVAAAGEHSGSRGIAHYLPLACGILIFLAVLSGGQILMTSTVEEKSNRVMEVLLAAVSPMELMCGKLLGTLASGLTLTAVYVGFSFYGLTQYSMAGLLDPILIVYVFAFYVVTFLVFGSLMMAIGSAVDQIADAQSLMGPITILLVVGYTVTPVIGAAPNSTLSVALSFTPFINTFAMLARVASNSPPPVWQVGATLLIGCATAAVMVWFASKIFRMALLMHGKPPSLATLFKWAWMA